MTQILPFLPQLRAPLPPGPTPLPADPATPFAALLDTAAPATPAQAKPADENAGDWLRTQLFVPSAEVETPPPAPLPAPSLPRIQPVLTSQLASTKTPAAPAQLASLPAPVLEVTAPAPIQPVSVSPHPMPQPDPVIVMEVVSTPVSVASPVVPIAVAAPIPIAVPQSSLPSKPATSQNSPPAIAPAIALPVVKTVVPATPHDVTARAVAVVTTPAPVPRAQPDSEMPDDTAAAVQQTPVALSIDPIAPVQTSVPETVAPVPVVAPVSGPQSNLVTMEPPMAPLPVRASLPVPVTQDAGEVVAPPRAETFEFKELGVFGEFAAQYAKATASAPQPESPAAPRAQPRQFNAPMAALETHAPRPVAPQAEPRVIPAAAATRIAAPPPVTPSIQAAPPAHSESPVVSVTAPIAPPRQAAPPPHIEATTPAAPRGVAAPQPVATPVAIAEDAAVIDDTPLSVLAPATAAEVTFAVSPEPVSPPDLRAPILVTSSDEAVALPGSAGSGGKPLTRLQAAPPPPTNVNVVVSGPAAALSVAIRAAGEADYVRLRGLVESTAAEFGMDVADLRLNGSAAEPIFGSMLGGNRGSHTR